MKRFFLTIIMTALVLAAPAKPDENVRISSQGDTTTIVAGGDTVSFVGMSNVAEKLNVLLSDTLINLSESEGGEPAVDYLNHPMRLKRIREMHEFASDIVAMSAWAIISIVLLAMLFSYLKRRRKYRMVEKAIENNYPLPPYIFGGTAVPPSQPVVTVQPVVTAAPAPSEQKDDNEPLVADPWASGTAQQPQQPSAQTQYVMSGRVNWRAFKSSFIWLLIGVGSLFLFWETPMVAFAVVAIIVSAAKAFVEYQDQRDAILTWHRNQQSFTPPTSFQPQSQPRQQSQQPDSKNAQ